jgi:hypothetical protein
VAAIPLSPRFALADAGWQRLPDSRSTAVHHGRVRRFIDDDAGYLQWLAANPDGYVLNTHRKPTPDYLMLHRVGCSSIRGAPARGIRWTSGYIKICGERGELEAFARRSLGGDPQACRLCL